MTDPSCFPILPATVLTILARAAAFGGLILVTAALQAADGQATSPPEMDDRLRAIVSAPLVLQPPTLDGVEVRSDLPYSDGGDEGPRLDVYLPSPEDASGGEDRRPVLVFVHGGPLSPDIFPEPVLHPKEWQVYSDYGRLAASRGWIGVVPDHRFLSTASFEQSVADLEAVFRWLRRHAEALSADVDRIGAWTFSGAGVHLGWLSDETPDGVCAIAAFYPVASFATFEPLGLGTSPATVSDRWDPARRVTADGPPLLISRAGADSEHINRSIDDFSAAAVAAGATVDLLVHPTGAHGFDLAADGTRDVLRSRQIIQRTLDFFADAFEVADAAGENDGPLRRD